MTNNSISLVGRAGQDPKAFEFNGKKKVVFSLGVREHKTNESGEQVASTMWVEVHAWNGIGDQVMSAISKGRQVTVEGRLAMNSFMSKTDTGEQIKKTVPIVRLSNFKISESKSQSD